MRPSASADTGPERTVTDRPRYRDAHFVLGTDSAGLTHHRSLVDELVFWIDTDTGRIVERGRVADGRTSDYVEAVATDRGWQDIRYGERAEAQSWAAIAAEQERARTQERETHREALLGAVVAVRGEEVRVEVPAPSALLTAGHVDD